MTERRPNDYKRHSFRATIAPRAQANESGLSAPTMNFTATLETATQRVTLAYRDREMLTTSPDGQCFLLFCGDIFRPQTTDTGATLLDLYQQRGMDFVRDIHGTFTFVLIDRRADLIALVTDRHNSYKLYVSRQGETLIVSNTIHLQPLRGAHIDRIGVACYLSGGYLYNDRTLFEPVRALASASIYRLQDDKLHQEKYWHFIFPATSSASSAALKRELGDIIVEATRTRLRSDRPIYLSLSAGYDSRAILGVLAEKLHVRDVHCFTYFHGSVRPNTDEAVSAQLATLCGYTHELVPSFDGDAVQTLRRNGHLSNGMIQACDEIDALYRLGEQADGAPVLYVGDTLWLGSTAELTTIQAARSAAYMPDFNQLCWLERWLGSSLYQQFDAAVHAEIHAAIRHVPPTADLYNFRDMLRFDQAMPRGMGAWRECYAGHFFMLANPLLDDDMLELILRTPSSLRRGKRLYIETVTEMFPKLFALPRAVTASYASYWPEAIRQQNAGLRAFVAGEASPLDDIIAPDIIIGLLAAQTSRRSQQASLLAATRKSTYHLLQRLKLHTSPLVRHFTPKPAVPAFRLITRLLTLRSFLSETA